MTNTPELELYAIPFACSLAAHVALREGGVPHTLQWVTRDTLRLEEGGDFTAVNPKGKVAALRLPSRELVTETAAVLLSIADLCPPGALAPPPDDRPARRRTFEWLTFIATELHKQVLSPSFDPATPGETKRDVLGRHLPKVLGHLEVALTGREWLQAGERPWVPDAYVFWTLLMVEQLGVDLAGYPALHRFRRRMAARPQVEAVIALERTALSRGAR